MNTDAIRDAETEALALSIEYVKISEMARAIKSQTTADIEQEWEDTGNKAMSNATKRNIIVEKALKQRNDYNQMIEATQKLSIRQRELDIEISFLKREFRRETGHCAEIQNINTSLESISSDINIFLQRT